MAEDVVQVTPTITPDALTIARTFARLFALLAEQQQRVHDADLFIEVKYRTRGEYLALFGAQQHGPVTINQRLYYRKGHGATYEDALIDLTRAMEAYYEPT